MLHRLTDICGSNLQLIFFAITQILLNYFSRLLFTRYSISLQLSLNYCCRFGFVTVSPVVLLFVFFFRKLLFFGSIAQCYQILSYDKILKKKHTLFIRVFFFYFIFNTRRRRKRKRRKRRRRNDDDDKKKGNVLSEAIQILALYKFYWVCVMNVCFFSAILIYKMIYTFSFLFHFFFPLLVKIHKCPYVVKMQKYTDIIAPA